MEAKESVFYSKKTWNAGGKLLDLSSPLVMGILNVTPDSFFDGGNYESERDMLARTEKMVLDGASMIDIGGYSSRPSSDNIPVEEELRRVLKATICIRKTFPELILSIDTFRAEVARQCLDQGANIINDISGGELDKNMFSTIRSTNAPYILMHMRGTPQTMKNLTHYDNILLDLIDYFQKKINILQALGIKDLAIDPGFGFAKSISGNYELLKNLNYFQTLNQPICVGLSRKSMIYNKLKGNSGTALNGTTVINTIALMKGANILRVHDVKEAVEAITLYNLSN